VRVIKAQNFKTFYPHPPHPIPLPPREREFPDENYAKPGKNPDGKLFKPQSTQFVKPKS
jgi:hypothetical protein